ncbi:MAG: hypothetical protein IJC74_05975 [Clostridia bacterium]|nr:hypothetical protein [Clostridia bacterium]
MINTLKNIMNIPSVSGNEEYLKEYIISEIKNYCDEYYVDNFGNLIVKINGNDETLMINTPMDESGFLITHKEENKLYFAGIGGISPKETVGKFVKAVDGEAKGIIVADKEINDELKFSDMHIEAFGEAETGDIFALENSINQLGDNIFGYALSRKAGVAVLLEAIKKSYKNNTKTLYFAFSAEDLLGFKGAKVASNVISPDYTVVITSSCEQKNLTDAKFGGGIAVRIKDNIVITNKAFRKSFTDKFDKNDIPYQLEIAEKGVFNSEAAYNAGGSQTAVLGYFVKNPDTTYECISIKDIENLVKALENL